MAAFRCGVAFPDSRSAAARRIVEALRSVVDFRVETVAPGVGFDVIAAGVGVYTINSDLAALAAIRADAPSCPIVAVLETLDAARIEALLTNGACDFVSATSAPTEIVARLRRAAGLFHASPPCATDESITVRIKDFVGTSPNFMKQVAKLPMLARCDAGVLILGETGTGKEVFARATHYLSSRAGKPWVAINCGAIPTELIESELFGHVKGAFTMAHQARQGLVSEAQSGTLFLDDVDCLPLAAQAKLLRFLEQREYRPVGSNTLNRADVRVIAASNDRLPERVAAGTFRQDLFFRLSVLSLKLPPLRERREDIPTLTIHYMRQFARDFGRDINGISPEARYKLLLHAWPGNVRELKHVVERAVLLAKGRLLEADDIDIDGAPEGAQDADSFRDAKSRAVETFERGYIELVLARCNGNITHAARVAKKNRRAFFELMRKHSIESARFRSHPG